MKKTLYDKYIKILREEMVLALGCTEPIAIALCACIAKEALNEMPTSIEVLCSGNIIKNTKCVTVPNSGGLVGVEAAAICGIVNGDSKLELEVITKVNAEQLELIHQLYNQKICVVKLLESDIPLHIIVKVKNGTNEALAEIKHSHTFVCRIEKNNKVLFSNENDQYLGRFSSRECLCIDDIYEFANTVSIDDVKDLIDQEIECNMRIAEVGLEGNYGVGIGKIILENYGHSTTNLIKAYSASASEARMSGCDLPVMTNSGSGNQGMTTSIPVIIYAKENKITEEVLYRSLVLSNLITIHQKTSIGRLSAFCGAVSAACGSGAAITYMCNGSLQQIKNTISNTLANAPGIVCDGAKATCGAKIATALDGAILGHYMAMSNRNYDKSFGILHDDIEKTIKAVGSIGKEGMKYTDKTILNIMLEEADNIKFKRDYEMYNNTLNELDNQMFNPVVIALQNPIKYINIDEAINHIQNKRGLMLFAKPTCPFVRSIIEIIIKQVNLFNIDCLYYLDCTNLRDELASVANEVVEKSVAHPHYEKLVALLDLHLNYYKGFEVLQKKRLLLPTFIKFDKGEIIAFNEGTIPSQNNKYQALSSVQSEEMIKLLDKFFN